MLKGAFKHQFPGNGEWRPLQFYKGASRGVMVQNI